MNIYEMYYENNYQFGFFVIRDSWSGRIAKIIGIENVKEGESIEGKKPYFKNQKVRAEFYKVRNARNINNPKEFCFNENLQDIGELSCPGTFAYEMVK